MLSFGRDGHASVTAGLSLVVALGLGPTACTAPIAGSLDEAQANRILVALDQAGVGSEKEQDPAAEGRFRVVVQRDDAQRALSVMHDEDLPAQPVPSLLDAVGRGSLVPSPMAEHTQFVAGLTGELERTLSTIDGVLSARVHLSLPWRDALSDAPRAKASASVLVKHRPGDPPIDASAIRRLVAGAAPSLAPDDVTVVLVARPAAAPSAERSLARFGPIWVSRGSLSAVRQLAVVCICLDLALFGMVMLLWARAKRLRAALLSREPSSEPRREPAQRPSST